MEPGKQDPPQKRKKPSGMMSFVWEVVKFVVLALIIVLPIRIYIAQPYLVSGNSMVPTFQSGNYLIVDQLTYRLDDPARGDVIIFRFPLEPSKFFIKRIIGLPEETIHIRDGVIYISKGGENQPITLEEPFLGEPYHDTFEIQLKDDEYFVMGDNRSASLDSRIWGPLSKDFVVGRALVRLLPITEASIFPGKMHYENGKLEN